MEGLAIDDSAIVFVDRNVFQSRGQLAWTVDEWQRWPSNDGLMRDRGLGAGLRSTGTVLLVVSGKLDTSSEFCIGGTVEGGSGTLVSDSRAQTAWHVVGPFPVGDEPSVCERNDDPVVGHFEATLAPDGETLNDTFAAYSSNDVEAASDDHIAYRCDDGPLGEIPFLPNRLLSLGLDSWIAPEARDSRRRLRFGWKFRFDRESISDMLWDSGAREYRGNDVAVIEACNRYEHDETVTALLAPARVVPLYEDDGTPTGNESVFSHEYGPFPLDKPAVFFNQTRAVSADQLGLGTFATGCSNQPGCPFTVNEDLLAATPPPMFALAAPPFPEDGDGQGVVISNPGFPFGTATPPVVTGVCGADGEGNASIRYLAEMTGTLDGRQGASGGAVLFPTRFAEIETLGPWTGELRSGAVFSGSHGQGWWVSSQSESVTENAYTLELTERLFESINAEAPADPERFSSYAALSPYMSRQANGDLVYAGQTGGDPLNPQPQISSDIPEPCFFYHDAVNPCSPGGGSGSGQVSLYIPIGDVDNGFEDPSTMPDGDPLFYSEGELEQERRFACAFPVPGTSPTEYLPGIAVGFAGSPFTLDRDSREAGIGGLQLICAPFWSGPFTQNWRFLVLHGRPFVGLLDTVRDIFPILNGQRPPTYSTSFRWAINHYAEARLNDATPSLGVADFHARPLSFKTCPPNHYLTGASLLVRDPLPHEGEDRVYVGIQSLQCRRKGDLFTQPHVIAANDLLSDANLDEWSPCNVAEMTWVNLAGNNTLFSMCEQPFWLMQRVGEPVYQDATSENIFCPPGSVVAGFEHVTNDRAMQRFKLICHEAPTPPATGGSSCP